MNEIEIKATINKVSEQRNAALNDAVMLHAKAESLAHQLQLAKTEIDELKLNQKKRKPKR